MGRQIKHFPTHLVRPLMPQRKSLLFWQMYESACVIERAKGESKRTYLPRGFTMWEDGNNAEQENDAVQ